MTIQNFSDFVFCLLQSGFSMGGTNAESVFAASSLFGQPVNWHTGDPETDPWEWRMRVLEERDDIAYAKVFFRKSGYITKAWYPYFLAVRRPVRSFMDEYHDGLVSQDTKRIYEVIASADRLPFHEIKQLAGFSQKEKSRFERILVDLQMNMHITLCGRQQKRSYKGIEYGWSSTVFCTVERFFGTDILDQARIASREAAIDTIKAQVYRLNPAADPKSVERFILG